MPHHTLLKVCCFNNKSENSEIAAFLNSLHGASGHAFKSEVPSNPRICLLQTYPYACKPTSLGRRDVVLALWPGLQLQQILTC